MANAGGSSLAKGGSSASLADKFAAARATTRAPGLGAAAAATFARNEAQAVRAAVLRQGGREWQKGDHHRVYVGEKAGLGAIGVKVSRYNTGNIAAATRNGKKISNSLAAEYVQGVKDTYFDVRSNKFHGDMGVAKHFRQSR